MDGRNHWARVQCIDSYFYWSLQSFIEFSFLCCPFILPTPSNFRKKRKQLFMPVISNLICGLTIIIYCVYIYILVVRLSVEERPCLLPFYCHTCHENYYLGQPQPLKVKMTYSIDNTSNILFLILPKEAKFHLHDSIESFKTRKLVFPPEIHLEASRYLVNVSI